MPDMKMKLDRFTAAILAQATQETERTLDDVRRRRDEAYSAAEDQVLREAYQYIHREVARIKSESGRGVSKHMLDNKRKLYLRREQMAQETFALVREKIEAFTKTPAYLSRLRALLDEALATLSGSAEVQVFLRAEDLPLAQPLQASCGGARRLTFREGGFQLGGLVAESEQLGLRVDSSFDSAAGELSGHFAELFGISLSDDDSPEGGNAQ